MYSLPISTYSDYWRATKSWSAYLGGVAVFAAGTRYSTLAAPDINHMIKPTFQQASVSRGVSIQGGHSLGVVNEGITNQGIAIHQGVERKTNKIEMVDIEIPFDTQYVETDKLLPGKSEIQEKGEKGILRQVIKTFEVDGQIDHQQIQSSLELKSPKQEVILKNTKPVPKKKVLIQSPSATEGKGFELANESIRITLKVEATAYTYTGNNTATGVAPRHGLIAVDPKVIAMGSKVYVEGYGYAIAADTGGAIRGNKIDVFFPSFRQCIDWGRKSVQIYVLQPN